MEEMPEADTAKRLGSADVSKLLAQRWDLSCGREALVAVSDQLGLETRDQDTPRAHRRWTIEQVQKVAPAVLVRRLLAPDLADELIAARDHARIGEVAAFLDPARFGTPEVQAALAKQSTAA